MFRVSHNAAEIYFLSLVHLNAARIFEALFFGENFSKLFIKFELYSRQRRREYWTFIQISENLFHIKLYGNGKKDRLTG